MIRLGAGLLAVVVWHGLSQAFVPPLGLDGYLPVPEDNPLTIERVALGRRLFFDPLLSTDGTVTCGTCHLPERAFTDGRPQAIGVLGRHGTRNAPTLVNRAYGSVQFWDGRVSRLEEQVLEPIGNPSELGSSIEDVTARLARDPIYALQFRSTFGREVNPEDVARALASYVRTILAGDAPIDRYVAGDREALESNAREGLRLFRGKGNCSACHVGPSFTDERFHNTGVAWRVNTETFADEGRFAITGGALDHGAFKTPTLREVARVDVA